MRSNVVSEFKVDNLITLYVVSYEKVHKEKQEKKEKSERAFCVLLLFGSGAVL